MTNRIQFFVVFGAIFANAAYGANLSGHGLSTHTDIIAQGNVKQGEFGETPERTIPSRAAQVGKLRGAEGVTTRERAKAVISPRAPCSMKMDEEIVWTARLNLQKHGIKSPCDNKTTTIQNRSGKLADNVTNNNAILRKLKAKNNVRPFGGGNVILNFGAI